MLSALLIMSPRIVLAEGEETNSTDSATENAEPEKKFNAGEVILDHISDSHEWHLFSVGEKEVSIPLPVILFSSKGLDIFMSGSIHEAPERMMMKDGKEIKVQVVMHGGKRYLVEDGKFTKVISDTDAITGEVDQSKIASVYDLSITKNVMQLLIAFALMMWLFLSVAKKYKTNGDKAPTKVQSAVEVIVIFIRDGVAKPMLGKKYMKYLPYLLSLFFFIWINNLIGLFPAAANVTGNIAVTATLAAMTFILMMVGSKRHYWSHMFAPPGVPTAVKFLLVPIELISNILVKPFALMIRLFANMLAGHLIVLSFMSIIFIFAAMNVGAGLGASVFSVAFCIFIYMLELLVAALQAYIFTILTALFIGETSVDHSHHEEKAH